LIILADEPTGEVDTKTRDMIVGILKQLSQKGQTILVVTHDPGVARRTDRIITMSDGRIISDKPSNEVKNYQMPEQNYT